MTLDEAIAKAKADGDVQLAEWLRQTRGADAAARWYTEKLRELEDENAKLRELVRKLEHYERIGCHECPYEDSCDAGTLYDEECAMSREIEREKGELGVDER